MKIAVLASGLAIVTLICFSQVGGIGPINGGGTSGGGGGSVTSVGFTGGLVSVANPTTTPAFTVAGTSGGIPYFSGTAAWASSAVLVAHGVVVGGGVATAPTTTTAGNAGLVLTSNGASADPTFQSPTGMALIPVQEWSGGSGATSSYTFTFPRAMAASGNTGLLFVAADASAAVGFPSGWTVDLNITSTTYSRLAVLHVASAGQTSATFTASASNFGVWFMEVRGSHSLDVNTNTVVNGTGSGTVNLAAITPTSGSAVFGLCALTTNSSSQSVALGVPNNNRPWQTVLAQADTAGGSRILAGAWNNTGVTPSTTTVPPVIFTAITLFTSGGQACSSFSIL